MSASVNFWAGLDVHKESITAAVFRNRDPEPLRVDRLRTICARSAATSSASRPRGPYAPATPFYRHPAKGPPAPP
jgi:hypothetical protein